jgi:hypothetical protein
MKLVPSSTVVVNTRHFPVGITGAIVSNDGETMLLAVPAKAFGAIRHTFQTRLPSENRGIMSTGSSKSLDSRTWRELYKAALFEVDKTKLPERIAQAEKAIALKARELFYVAGDSIEEGQALDDAVYALRALRNTSQTNHCMPPVVAVV